MSICLTEGVQVVVQPFFMPEHSHSQSDHFVFGYEVTVANNSESAVQLTDRHWIVTDGTGRVQSIRGTGVIGQQPTIAAGESFCYRSFCPLATSHGFMRGSFGMVRSNGQRFEAIIASFALLLPCLLN